MTKKVIILGQDTSIETLAHQCAIKCAINDIIPCFIVGDKVKTLTGKNSPDKIYREYRKGAIGIIEKIGFSLNKVCYWVNFGNYNSWVNEDELNAIFIMDKTIYFQPPGIRSQYCEAGMILESDPDYILYYNEPCKILISEVKIIPKEQIHYDKKSRSYLIKSDAS